MNKRWYAGHLRNCEGLEMPTLAKDFVYQRRSRRRGNDVNRVSETTP